ncbi:MAG TPA: carboxypeptidase-like regulatory domain-containing protein [Amaricoccus sp.]|nr:carboxypeptidase-like regulatory domain-containing protein [Amaricoccus sp.]
MRASGAMWLICLGIAPSLAAAQSSVVGTVATEAGVPVPGLPVIVENGTTQSVAITDAEGRFDAQVPSGDDYRVVLPQPGYGGTAVPPVGDAPVSVGRITLEPW